MKKRKSLLLSNQTLLRFDREVADETGAVLCGVDEAGRGPLAGPVVVCAAIVKDPDFVSRIDDSKKLSPSQRDEAYAEILQKCVVSIAVYDEKRIDEMNIFRATLSAFVDAFDGLREKPTLVLIDGNADVYLPCARRLVTGGDARSFTIACASIVAKVTRDRIMRAYHDRYPEYGFDQHKGYGTPQHMAALQKHGATPIHRRSFAPVALALAGQDPSAAFSDLLDDEYYPEQP